MHGLPLPPSAAATRIAGAALDPSAIAKFGTPLVIPPAMPRTRRLATRQGAVDYYEIGMRQFRQQILPDVHPATTVWSYGSVNHPESFNYPAFTVEAAWRSPVRIKWINELVDSEGRFLPHLLPVDPTLHWANPPGGRKGRDMRPSFSETPGRYTGPVPIVTHLHGAAGVGDESDGYAEAWYLPNATNIDPHFAKVGTWYQFFRAKAQRKFGQAWTPGSAVFQYPNGHRAATLWYHDHTMSATAQNVWRGLFGLHVVHDDEEEALGLPSGDRDLPVMICDRSFAADGSVLYPPVTLDHGMAIVPPEY
jgi:FtsP/CotA-like multicopper oxidase with cupredoxin domain